VNALSLYHDLKQRGVVLKADGEHLLVDAPTGVVTEEDKSALLEVKPVLLKLLYRIVLREQEKDDGAASMPGAADTPATHRSTTP
jgi:hypothetical protein